jgi:hypothetical protein
VRLTSRRTLAVEVAGTRLTLVVTWFGVYLIVKGGGMRLFLPR